MMHHGPRLNSAGQMPIEDDVQSRAGELSEGRVSCGSLKNEVSMILRHSILSEGYFLTDMKRQFMQVSVLNRGLPYDSFDTAASFL